MKASGDKGTHFPGFLVIDASFFRSWTQGTEKQLCGFPCLSKHMCFQLALLGWNSPVPGPGQLPPLPSAPHLESCWAPALGQTWGLNGRLLPPHHFSIPSLGVGRAGGPPSSLSESCYSESLKTAARRRASKGGLGGGWR